MAFDKYGNDPARFAANPEDIKPLGRVKKIVDHTSPEQQALNAEHERIVKQALDEHQDDTDGDN